MDDRLNTLMQDTAPRQAFGACVKRLRKEHDWSQEQLAGHLDIRFQLLNKYEGGQHIPPAKTLIKPANGLGTTVDYLLCGNPQQEPPNVVTGHHLGPSEGANQPHPVMLSTT